MRFNPVSAIVAGVAFYAVQSVWYIALGKLWLSTLGPNPPGPARAATYIVGFVVALIVGFVVETALHDSTDPSPPVHGLKFGAFFGIGIFALNLLVIHQFEGRPIALTLIDGGAVTVCLMAAGLVVGYFHRNNAKA